MELNLMIENKIDKQIKNKTKDLEIKKMTETLYSEKCNFERLKNEYNSLKVKEKGSFQSKFFLFRVLESQNCLSRF